MAAGLVGAKQAQVWNVDTGVPLHAWSIDDPDQESWFKDIMLSRDGSPAVALLADGSLRSWDTATGNERLIAQPKLPGERGQQWHANDDSIFSHDGQTLALIGFEGLIQVIDVKTGNPRFKTSTTIRDPEYKGNIYCRATLEFAPDGQSFAFVRHVYTTTRLANGQSDFAWTGESTIVWLDSRTGHTRREIEIAEANVGGLAFSPDGRLMAAATSSRGDPGTIRIFRLRDKTEIQTIKTQSPWIAALKFSPDGNQIAAGLCDTSIVLWNVQRPD